uniref:Uncharacterized protein n=1 Tax=Arundo donax TaxID=35708 RepID=A0A0A8ZGQ3_ARUDO
MFFSSLSVCTLASRG